MKNVLFFVYLLVVGTLISCKSVDPTLIGPPRQPLYDYSEMNYYGYNGKDSSFLLYNEETKDWEQYIIEETRYVVVTQFDYYLIRFESKP
jgi:hypothetical protein